MASFLFSFSLLFKRSVLNIIRQGWKLKLTLLQTIMKILLIGVLFLN